MEDLPSREPIKNYYDELIEDQDFDDMMEPGANIYQAIAQGGYFNE